MSNDIVKTENVEWLSPENKKIIRSQFFPPNATDGEMQYCIGVAKAFNLNPILKQIYFVLKETTKLCYKYEVVAFYSLV